MTRVRRDDLHRSWSARKARRWAVQQWIAVNGWVCPGWEGGPYPDPHPVPEGYLSADHPTDVVAGGPMFGQEYGVLCRSCNSSKGARARAQAARARAQAAGQPVPVARGRRRRGGPPWRGQPPASSGRSGNGVVDLAW